MANDINNEGNISSLEPLPENKSSFSEIIRNKCLYVDKTEMIHKIITGPRAPYFLARPRGFGKTLLLDTFHDVFEGRKELFEGLKIAKLKYDWKSYPVIRIDMSGFNADPNEFQGDLTTELNAIANTQHEIDLKARNHVSALRQLIHWLSYQHRHSGQSGLSDKSDDNRRNVVILIDEYDAPILANIVDDKKCEAIRKILHNFYRVIKAQYRFVRTAFITGITSFKRLSLFSDFNNMFDISFESDFSTICGFTGDELRTSFRNHLVSALKIQENERYVQSGSSIETLVAKILSRYDVYSFDGIHNVLNPYSIVSFFAEKKFGDQYQ
ncbi:MAG: AAA family ATPase [Deltaproteobacteria bacterium]|nr:AAA family ATPase [Deltaproteobacteria bacterium]